MATGDFSTAFLNAPIVGDIFARPPKVICNDPECQVMWQLKRALYSMRQSPRLFFFHLFAQMMKMSFTVLKSQPTMFMKANMIVVAYVGDVLVAGGSQDI